MLCNKCGNQLEDDAYFCPFCGAKNDDKEDRSNGEAFDNSLSVPKTEKSVPWKVIALFAVIAVSLIIVFSFVKNRDRNNISTADISTGKYTEDYFTAADTTLAETTIILEAQIIADKEESANKVKIGNMKYDINMTDTLVLSDRELTDSDIVDLQYMTNITGIDLSNNNITDISPISNLTNLSYLCINDNNISDISALSKLTNLRELFLINNSISDISALSKLTNLRKLFLINNSISDISALSNLTSLEWLCLDNNSISDISALSTCTMLNEVSLPDNNISDLTPLSKCRLSCLDVSNNPLNGNFQALRGLNFTYGSSDRSLYIGNCGFEKYLLTDENGNYNSASDEFEEDIRDNIQIKRRLIVNFDGFSVIYYEKIG